MTKLSIWLYGILFSFETFASSSSADLAIPRLLESYGDSGGGLLEVLTSRIAAEPFNLVAAFIFFCAICHTFFAGFFMKLSDKVQKTHVEKRIAAGTIGKNHNDVSFLARILHYFGEVEAIFGIWVIVLMAAVCHFFNWSTVVGYLSHKVNFTEPMFVVVIMTIASTRPILNFSENCLRLIASIGHRTPAAWWLSILTIAPLLGSFITEPAAMTIGALLLGKQFYAYGPSNKFKYATLGLLFVNVSVGGTLTNFAAPPVLMVAAPWDWSSSFMALNFGWKAALGILLNNAIYFAFFNKELFSLATLEPTHDANVEVTSDDQSDLVPGWVVLVHIGFMVWTVFNAHYPVLFVGGLLFFLGFMHTTPQHQNRLELKGPLLVGFFLAGLIIHGGLQGWWIEPVLSSMGEFSLLSAATILTSFNDNAAITYLSTLVPGFSDQMKYLVVAGAVTGGGLTVIANAPNPAGQSILSKFFPGKMINPLGLLGGAIFPTLTMFFIFWFVQ